MSSSQIKIIAFASLVWLDYIFNIDTTYNEGSFKSNKIIFILEPKNDHVFSFKHIKYCTVSLIYTQCTVYHV